MLIKKSFSVRAEVIPATANDQPVPATIRELFRVYQCAAYKATCAMICNTQTQLRYYDSLLFKENTNKNEYIWRKIVDCSDSEMYWRQSNQPLLDQYQKRRERVVSVRVAATSFTEPHRHVAKYIQSQNIFESSLSQDVTKIDLSNSMVRTTMEADWVTATGTTNKIPLEQDAINDHEAMALLCAVIEHMFEQRITPFAEENDDVVLVTATQSKQRVAPVWMQHFCHALSDSDQPRNVRYFLAKVVDNCRHRLRHYSSTLSAAVLRFMADECALTQQPSNLIYDLTVMLLEWSDSYAIHSPSETMSASALLKYMMLHAWHDRKDVYRQRLEIIKCMIELWRDVIVLPKQLLFDSIAKSSDKTSRANACGIQLNAIVVANRLLPWGSDGIADTNVLDNFMRLLFACLDNEHLMIYQSSAQLIGMCLQHLVEEPSGDRSAEIVQVSQTLNLNPCVLFVSKIDEILSEYQKEHYTILVLGTATQIGETPIR